jgi:hypothetical protein
MITIFRSDSAIVVMKGRARDVSIDFLFESQSEAQSQKQFDASSELPYEYGTVGMALRHRQG